MAEYTFSGPEDAVCDTTIMFSVESYIPVPLPTELPIGGPDYGDLIGILGIHDILYLMRHEWNGSRHIIMLTKHTLSKSGGDLSGAIEVGIPLAEREITEYFDNDGGMGSNDYFRMESVDIKNVDNHILVETTGDLDFTGAGYMMFTSSLMPVSLGSDFKGHVPQAFAGDEDTLFTQYLSEDAPSIWKEDECRTDFDVHRTYIMNATDGKEESSFHFPLDSEYLYQTPSIDDDDYDYLLMNQSTQLSSLGDLVQIVPYDAGYLMFYDGPSSSNSNKILYTQVLNSSCKDANYITTVDYDPPVVSPGSLEMLYSVDWQSSASINLLGHSIGAQASGHDTYINYDGHYLYIGYVRYPLPVLTPKEYTLYKPNDYEPGMDDDQYYTDRGLVRDKATGTTLRRSVDVLEYKTGTHGVALGSVFKLDVYNKKIIVQYNFNEHGTDEYV